MSSEEANVAPSLYRRLPMDWWQSAQKKKNLDNIPHSRFLPNKNDTNGLSVSQSHLSSIEVASTSARTGKRSSLAEFPTVVATNRGLTISPRPTEHDPGHAEIPEMNYSASKDSATEDTVIEHAVALAAASRLVWPPGDNASQV